MPIRWRGSGCDALDGTARGTAMKKPRRQRRSTTTGVSAATVRRLALALPGVEEGLSYGTRAFRLRRTLLARLREDGESLVVRVDPLERDMLIEADPATFYVTDHYRDYPLMLVRLAAVRPDVLHELLERAWRSVAPRRLADAFDRSQD
jgi:hypothetical protein